MTPVSIIEAPPEPPWATLAHSLFAVLLYVLLFMLLIFIGGCVFDAGIRYVGYEFEYYALWGRALPSLAGLGTATLLLIFIVWGNKDLAHIAKVGHGNVQFIRCNIPGYDYITFKLNGGTHFVIPFFSKWKEEWHYDEAIPLKLPSYRISVKGQDIYVNAEGMGRMDHECLLVVHRMGSKDGTSDTPGIDSRRLFVKGLLEAVLQQAIEEECAKAFKNGHGLVFPGEAAPTQLKEIEDLIECGSALEEKIKVNLRNQDLRGELGSILEWFTLGDINPPEPVEKQRDANSAYRSMDKEAATLANSSLNGLSNQDVLKNLMIYSEAETRHDQTNTGRIDPGTLKGVLDAGMEIARLFLAKGGPPPNQQPPNP